MKIAIFLASMFLSIFSFGQTKERNTIIEETTSGCGIGLEYPEFPGGQKGMLKFIQNNLKYPSEALIAQKTGKVYISLVIDKNGKIIDPKIVQGIGFGCDEEAIRIIKLMPNWKAGQQNGKNVAFRFGIPINFELKK